MTELLSPAGDFECAKTALYHGCDAIYCAVEQFGARAYAKNLSLAELEKIISIAHILHKRVYVTVNTILKEDELVICHDLISNLYELGVDGLIIADEGLIRFVLKNYPEIEVHVSTQAGIKDLNDVLFFQNLKVHRVVLARECSIDEIKNIKENSQVPLEVFAHGALCVSYSGNCLLSSMLSLRSGNRGRCSQNCRRAYQLYQDDRLIGEKGFYLSMKDLNTSDHINELLALNIDSLKLEGRMKNKEYVEIITGEYRKLIDHKIQSSQLLDTIFHRPYTKGFIFHENSSQIVNPSKKSNEGEFIGVLENWEPNQSLVKLHKRLSVGDRIRIELPREEDYYFTIDELYNQNRKSVESANGYALLPIYRQLPNGSKIYRMINNSLPLSTDEVGKREIEIRVDGRDGSPLVLSTIIDGKEFHATSNLSLSKAVRQPLTTEQLLKQMDRLKETPFVLKLIHNQLIGDLFIPVAEMNLARRNLLNEIMTFYQQKRILPKKNNEKTPLQMIPISQQLSAFCTTEEQYKACRDLGLEAIYYKNYSPDVASNYQQMDQEEILVGGHGGLHYYTHHRIVSDYTFNILNSEALGALYEAGVQIVTLSLEASLKDVKAIVEGFKNQYQTQPNLEMIVYGKERLMTMKYCPLQRFNQCGICKNHRYFISDEHSSFELIHRDCLTYLLNSKPLNLIDELYKLTPYINRFRLQFTTETYQQTCEVIQKYQHQLEHIDEHLSSFDPQKETRGYFKRSIL